MLCDSFLWHIIFLTIIFKHIINFFVWLMFMYKKNIIS